MTSKGVEASSFVPWAPTALTHWLGNGGSDLGEPAEGRETEKLEEREEDQSLQGCRSAQGDRWTLLLLVGSKYSTKTKSSPQGHVSVQYANFIGKAHIHI